MNKNKLDQSICSATAMVNQFSLSFKNMGGGGNLNKRGLNIFLPMKRGRLSQEGLNREFLIIAVTTNLISSAIVTNHLEVPYLVFNLTKYI